MSIVDLLLNLACLLLWLNWRSIRLDPLLNPSAATIVGTLRRAEPHRLRSWYFLLALILVLVLRGLIYWQIGSAVNWAPRLQLISITLSFRSDFFASMLWFSFFSFALTLAIFYLWLLFLSLINGRAAEPDPVQRLLSAQLGATDRWPAGVKLLLPLLVAALVWLAIMPLLTWLELTPRPPSPAGRIEQAMIIALGGYLTWKYIIGAVLALYVVSSYVYLGNHAIWTFIAFTGRRLLIPLRWLPLRAGKIDFAPLVEIALVFFGAEFAQRGLTGLYKWLAV